MSRRTLVNLALFGLLLLLALVAWLEPGLQPEAPPPPIPLAQLDTKTLSRITLVRGSERLQFERHDGQWWLIGKPALPANPFRLGKLLTLPALTSHDRFPVAGQALESYGLASPQARLEFDDRLRLSVGASTPLGDRRYLQIGEQVHIADDTPFYYLQGSRERFIDGHLLPAGHQLIGIDAPSLRLWQKGGEWQAEPPLASADQLVALLDAWAQAQALEVRTSDNTAGGESLTLQLYDGQTLHYRLLRGEREWRFVRDDAGLEYLLRADSAAALLRLPALDPADSDENTPHARTP